MNKHYVVVIALCAALALMLATAGQMAAQEQTAKGNMIEYKGRVNVVSKESSSVAIQSGSRVIQVKYTATTKFTYRNKPGSIDDLKEGRRVIVLVDPAQKDKMVATRIDVREGK